MCGWPACLGFGFWAFWFSWLVAGNWICILWKFIPFEACTGRFRSTMCVSMHVLEQLSFFMASVW